MIIGMEVDVIIDRPLGSRHPAYDLIYPLNYGYVPGFIGGDGEEQDVYVIGVDVPLHQFHGVVIGVVEREDDCESKWIVASQQLKISVGELEKQLYFQERYFKHTIYLKPNRIYRLAKEEEACTIAQLVKNAITQTYPHYYPENIIDFFLTLHQEGAILKDIQEHKVFVLYDHGTLVATGTLNKASITRVYVHPFFQRGGYGTYVMDCLEERARKRYDTIQLDASLPAVMMYEKRGYQTITHDCCIVNAKTTLVYEIMEKVLDEHQIDLLDVYHSELPDFLIELSKTPAMLRLKEVGMHCGCEYTLYPRFQFPCGYSRYEHSLGVALIIWHVTKDKVQAIAGLFHDIATPVFAHVIDFLHQDYEKQESTEERTRAFIEESKEIQRLLIKYGITTQEVEDYHRYPIADNDSPRLSADRLEYTLGNFLCRGLHSKEEIKAMYEDLIVSEDEDGCMELAFQTKEIAKQFTLSCLNNSFHYISDEDRFSMQYLANMIKDAIDCGILTEEDLYTTERQVIQKLQKHKKIRKMWNTFCEFHEICVVPKHVKNSVSINAKKRMIDPLIHGSGRMSACSDECQRQMILLFTRDDKRRRIIDRSILET